MRTRTTRMPASLRRLNALAPLIGLVTVLVLPLLLQGPAVDAEGVRRRHDAIRATVEALPYRVGRWVGEDVPIPTAAQEILRANVLVSRRYSELGGDREMLVAIVHCTDMRDMNGHYPPICYPATGWTFHPERTESFSCDIEFGPSLPMRLYRFDRPIADGSFVSQSVANGFILPDGRLVADMDAIAETGARSRAASAEGVAQIQLLIAGEPSLEDVSTVVTDFLGALPPDFFQTLAGGPRDSTATEPDADA